ncbi:MAG: T9SS type A sorting domain-containing protein [Opitutaceae bacterium]|nr:T9SS type A sorting domain-containing protein [Cytophagales bacterium]
MKTRLLASFFCILYFISPSFAQWAKVDVGNSSYIHFVKYFSEQKIFITAGDGIITSDNGGITWQKKTVVDTLNKILYADIGHVHFLNDNEAIASGIMYTNTEALLRTKNGGQSWYLVHSYNGGGLPRAINQTEFSGDIGYGVGYNGRILKSIDRGKHWTALNSGTTTTKFSSLKVLDANTIVVVGDQIILRSTNGGTSWTTMLFPGQRFTSVDFKDALTGVTAGNDGDAYSTMDGGQSWTKLTTILYYSVQKVKYFEDGVFLLGNGTFLTSKDQGKSWEKQVVNPFKIFEGVDFFKNNVYVVGRNLVYRTSNLSATSRPIAGFTSNRSLYCKDSTVTFTNSGSDNNSYQWYLNKQLVATTKHFTYKIPSGGSDNTIRLIASNGTFKDTVSDSFNVEPELALNLTASIDNTELCNQYSANITVQNSQMNAQYQFMRETGPQGNLQPGTGNDLVFNTGSLTSTTSFTVSASASNRCGTITKNKTFTVNVGSGLPLMEWEELPIKNYPTNNSVNSIDFINEKIGFGTGASTGEFLKTTDGGVNWKVTSPLYQWAINPTEVDFVNEKIGYAANNVLYKTTDGGETFERISEGNMIKVKFINAYTGFVGTTGTGELYKTIDGGKNMKPVIDLKKYQVRFTNLDCPSANVCYTAVGFYDNIPDTSVSFFRSIDGGDTWKHMKTPSNIGFSSIDFVDELTGYGISLGNVYKTEDGGFHWSKQSVIENNSPDMAVIKFASKDIGYIAGGYNLGFNGVFRSFILKTENGGKCWNQVTQMDNYRFEDIEIPSDSTIYISGAQSIYGKGTVLKNKLGNWAKFAVADTVVCPGDSLWVESTSIGYNNFSWYVDGQFQKQSANSYLKFLGIGLHIIKLIATKGESSDSAQKIVRVMPSPNITFYGQPPAEINLCSDKSYRTNVIVNGNGTNKLSYQWQIGKDITFRDILESGNSVGVKTAELLISPLRDTLNNMFLRCKVTPKCAKPEYSIPSKLILNRIPSILQQPGNVTVCKSEPVVLSVETSNNVTSFQWRVYANGSYNPEMIYDSPTTYSGTTSANLTINTPFNNYKYQCTITNECGSVYTRQPTLTVGCVGLEDENAQDNIILIAPNPVSGQFFKVTSTRSAIKILSLRNAKGQKVLEQGFEKVNECNLAIEKMANGLYFLQITFDNESSKIEKIYITNGE